jgi:glycosyl transferase family 2
MGQLIRKLEEMVSGTAEIVYSLLFGRQQARFIRRQLSISAAYNGRVIVSLSTLPDRIDNLEPTLRCLLEQTRTPDEIVVAVPRFSNRQQKEYIIPGYLEKIPRVRILRCQQDWGPASKIIPVIQEELAAGRANTLIMVVDDDRIYPRDALETYLHYHGQLSDAALCFRGALIPHSLVWFLPKFIRGNQIREPKPVAVITGTASYFVQPRFFDSALWDYTSAPKTAFYMDDIWISGSLDRRGVKKYVVPASAMMRAVRTQRGTMTLCDVPNGTVRSNTEVIHFFRDSWTAFFSRWILSLPIIRLWIRSFSPNQAGIKSGNASSVPKSGPAAAESGK